MADLLIGLPGLRVVESAVSFGIVNGLLAFEMMVVFCASRCIDRA